MKRTDLYRVVRKGLSERLTIEMHPEQCKGMMAEGIQRYDCVWCLRKNRMGTNHKYRAREQCLQCNSNLFLVIGTMLWLFERLFANNQHYSYNSVNNSDLCAIAIIHKGFCLCFSNPSKFILVTRNYVLCFLSIDSNGSTSYALHPSHS